MVKFVPDGLQLHNLSSMEESNCFWGLLMSGESPYLPKVARGSKYRSPMNTWDLVPSAKFVEVGW